jgi:hypothetical protein
MSQGSKTPPPTSHASSPSVYYSLNTINFTEKCFGQPEIYQKRRGTEVQDMGNILCVTLRAFLMALV